MLHGTSCGQTKRTACINNPTSTCACPCPGSAGVTRRPWAKPAEPPTPPKPALRCKPARQSSSSRSVCDDEPRSARILVQTGSAAVLRRTVLHPRGLPCISCRVPASVPLYRTSVPEGPRRCPELLAGTCSVAGSTIGCPGNHATSRPPARQPQGSLVGPGLGCPNCCSKEHACKSLQCFSSPPSRNELSYACLHRRNLQEQVRAPRTRRLTACFPLTKRPRGCDCLQ